jgi:hypothetical protein
MPEPKQAAAMAGLKIFLHKKAENALVQLRKKLQ